MVLRAVFDAATRKGLVRGGGRTGRPAARIVEGLRRRSLTSFPFCGDSPSPSGELSIAPA